MIRSLTPILFAALLIFAPAVHSQEQYKVVTRQMFNALDRGDMPAARNQMESYLAAHPDDLESMYGLAIVNAMSGDINSAMEYVSKSVDAGLPFSRFLAGPREWLTPLCNAPAFQDYAKRHGQLHDDLLVHGPLLGCVTSESARFWARTADEYGLSISLSDSPDMQTARQHAWAITKAENDYTATLDIGGLKPDTRYYYRLYVNGVQKTPVYSFKTFPEPDKPSKFQIGFGGGAGYTPPFERMWNTIDSHDPLAFLFMGDNVYIDSPTQPNVQRYCYYRRQSRPEFSNFTARRGIFAVWDDHDFVDNDSGGGPEIDTPPWKIPVWKLFQQNWANPAYGGGEAHPGCWFSFSIADVDFILLDSRYYREDPKTVESPSMLGAAQKQWLFDTLKQCKGTFKVIASPVPWSLGAKPGSLDPWQGYQQERDEIFSFIHDNRIEGVVLLSADRHRSDAWKIERKNAYDLYEFESSRLTNIHTHGLMPEAMFGYNEKCSFGLLTFDTTRTDPTVSFEIINIDDELIHKITVDLNQLKYKK
ncbi:MAG: alkaline phosphatase [bacterium]|nr:alkaline phosphatase [bacterium]